MSFYDQFQFHLNLYLILVSFKPHLEGCLLRLWTGYNPNFKTLGRYSTYPDVGSPTAGLRLLAKMIAFNLIAKESCYEKSKKPSQATGQQGMVESRQSDKNNRVRGA